MFGRFDELRAIEALLADARHARSGALVLRGEPGIGLTELLHAAERAAPDMTVIRVSGADTERGLPFAGLHQLCAPLLDRLAGLPPPQRAVLEAAFGLAEVTAEADVTLAGLAALTLLAQASTARPVLCLLDDAQCLDGASARAVALIACRLDRGRVALVVGARERLDGPDPFAALPHLQVRRLAPHAAHALVAAVGDAQLGLALRRRIVLEAAGNPLALCELSRDPLLVEPDGDDVVPLCVGPGVRRRFELAVRALPPATQTLLLLRAADRGAAPGVLWAAAEALGVGREAALPAVEGGLVVAGGDVELADPLMHLVVYWTARAGERRAAHCALADACDPELDADRAAAHRAAAALGPDDRLAGEVAAAALRAAARGDPARAGALWERAAGLTGAPRLRARWVVAAAQARFAGGSPGSASLLLAQARTLPLGPRERAQVARLRAAFAIVVGRGADAPELLLRAARDLERHEPELARATYLEALEAAVYFGRGGRGGAALRTAEAVLAASAAPGATLDDLLLSGLATLLTAGHRQGARRLQRAIALVERSGSPHRLALCCLAALELWDDRALHELVSHVRPQAEDAAIATLNEFTALNDIVAGRLAGAKSRFASVRGGHAAASTLGDGGSLLVAAWAGDEPEASRLAVACRQRGIAQQRGRQVALADYAGAVLYNGLGRYTEAAALAQQAAEARVFAVSNFALAELVEAAARSGERRLAADAATRLAEVTLPSSTDWGLGMLARSRALVATGAEVQPLYEEAVARLSASRALPQLARTELLYGEWLRRERRRRDARLQLLRAREVFAAMGSDGFTARCDLELRATGACIVRRTPEARDALTPRETQIVQLAVDGLSNQAIAAKLFISPRTVEHHLRSVYQRLGVGSRSALAQRLAPLARTPSPDGPPDLTDR